MKNKKLKSALIVITVLMVIGVVLFVALKVRDKKNLSSGPCGGFGNIPCTEELAKTGTMPVDNTEIKPADLENAWESAQF